MRLWRLVKRKFAPGLDGEGARLVGGRWNSPGVPVIYCASSVALAALEQFVHIPPDLRSGAMLPPLMLIGLDLDDDLIGQSGLATAPETEAARQIGNKWIAARASLALSVPARTVPFDRNILINPRHPDMQRVKVVVSAPFAFDSRLTPG